MCTSHYLLTSIIAIEKSNGILLLDPLCKICLFSLKFLLLFQEFWNFRMLCLIYWVGVSGSLFNVNACITLQFWDFFFFLGRAIPIAYGSSQARGWIGATGALLYHSSQQHRILNPLSKAMDWTSILMDTSQVCFCQAMIGTPEKFSWATSLAIFFLPFSPSRITVIILVSLFYVPGAVLTI